MNLCKKLNWKIPNVTRNSLNYLTGPFFAPEKEQQNAINTVHCLNYTLINISIAIKKAPYKKI